MISLDDMLKDASFRERTEVIQCSVDAKEIASHVAGFLNTLGGTVIVSINAISERGQDLHQVIARWISPSPLFSVSPDHLEGNLVSVIEVPAGKDKPFVCDGTIFLRTGQETVKATADDLQSMLQSRATEPERWERRACDGLSGDDFHWGEIDETNQRLTPSGPGEWSDRDIPEILHYLGCVRPDGSFTNAANICFSTLPGIRHPQARVRCYAFESETSDKYYDHEDIEAPIIQLIDRVRDFIALNVPKTTTFSVLDFERRTESIYPNPALREALINAFAHRDYAAHSGGVTIKVYPKQLEIWNSGSLPEGWEVKRLLASHPSMPNNPDIAHFLYIRGLMERIGRGTLKILEACREAKLPEPKWKTDDGVTLTFFGPLTEQELEDRLSGRQKEFLGSLSAGDAITPAEYRKGYASEVTERQARRDLVELEELGLLERKGAGRSTHYIRT